MVENRPFRDFLAYVILALGILVVAFPVYLAIVASTFDTATIINGNMPLLPGDQAGENYCRALFYGGKLAARARLHDDDELLHHGAGHRGR